MTMAQEDFDVRDFNRNAWDGLVRQGNRWTIPASPEEIDRARQGSFLVYLTPSTPVPLAWLPSLCGLKILGLASAGGQQGPILAAAGADVTILDNSPGQLGQDRMVAQREGLVLRCEEGDMRDLSRFADESFDLIFHPCSNCFVPEIRPVWLECSRVLRRGGLLLAGFVNPIAFITDLALEREGIVQLRYSVPYSDLDHLEEPQVQELIKAGEPLSFGHTLQDQIGGQLDAGLGLTHLVEDGWTDASEPLHRLMKCFVATRAVKL
jgi:SAM-dependent methyltransferase